jgi:hypothetical protein
VGLHFQFEFSPKDEREKIVDGSEAMGSASRKFSEEEMTFFRGAESLANGVIGRWHVQLLKFIGVNPSEVMAPYAFGSSFLNPAMIGEEKDGMLGISMKNGLTYHSHFCFNIQLLL